MEKQINDWYPIVSEAEYEAAMSRYQVVKYAPAGTQEHREKMLLLLLIEEYEQKHDSLPELDPIELIKFRMEDLGLKAAALAEVYGDRGTVSKVLNYKQPLSLSMIRKFSELLKIPAELLLPEYKLKSPEAV
ncbi:helix-turn-helix domain-containing protein [Dyadobacter fermentans]|uniref:Transcriptional regulator, XRE family n=1 Tax=Dyadobacter fermentans (strain ATCC 700827 / DSM 18053 / CIP 107007 / KCTC 52180 / NS114) TaxID=471854 RepID=C6VVJ1_DYAFD|nr:transcriptional regulator [Dyadobacter fermentans]ACT96721.1 transcriptional regulator, XRE family [Dyadobacter fermentans DSM 18053]